MSSALKLARKNREVDPQSWENLYKSSVVRQIREKNKIDINEELKIHRKALIALIEVVQLLHGKDIGADELKNLDGLIESCKSIVKWEMEYGE